MRHLSPAHLTRQSAGSDRVYLYLADERLILTAGHDRLDATLFLDVLGHNER